ncbi:hypothetical protein [Streptomyces sp. NPDC101115]|uniref:hypothetical protein n=1 Tax=Streptomyces sp. NPDC101115 TaxID=3366106 RepID=UPI0038069265
MILGDGRRPHRKAVALPLAAGADREPAGRDGVTAPEHAERRGFTELARLLRA